MNLPPMEPKAVWERFAWISAIPRPSHHEARVARALAERVAALGLAVSVDAADNVVARKPASPGREGRKPVILQAHSDMVAQAAPGVAHDFLRDPIELRVDPADPEWLTAAGTTLGADNGIGAAMALAMLEDDSLPHGPLACVFTSNEEDGMTGARALDAGLPAEAFFLNLDGELENELTIGCAGSVRTFCTLGRQAAPAAAGFRRYEAKVSGLRGGHSGVDIDKRRGNAIRLLAGLLAGAGPCRLMRFDGGSAANVIPREAAATVAVGADGAEAFAASFRDGADRLRASLSELEPGLTVVLEPADGPPAAALSPADTAALFARLVALPDGLVAMEPDIAGSIRTSLNLGKAAGAADGERFSLETAILVRCTSNEEKETLTARVEAGLRELARAGWSVETRRAPALPSWYPDLASPLLASASSAYRELFGADPRVASTHGGLECGLFRPRFPGWDMISIGPTILYPHSPAERLHIPSVERSYRFARELVSRL